ncbi:cell division protein FtsI (penicillin-binding protein 3) [Daejeonella rubra]|uniref:Cell division protein FtsI (Penicillin-binding protein 3) n=1 Tax=Daejeonella rubra TaxID=990371 RepID=A0A1G9MR16_9SPHI|nr:penicillin-binding protein [Daejeonella rubra]SDL76553.1 cell division protein FtsI (penicillin-binding protein 3) [Daejeonella rubra]
MNIRTDILLRVYIAFGLIVLLAFAVLFKLFHVQFAEGEKWRAMADSLSTRFANVEAARGNIYSIDGSLLATSVPEYEVRMDMLAGGIEKDDVFYEKVDSLAAKLSVFFGDKSKKQYSRMLREAREDKARYMLLKRDVTHQELKAIRKFPIFNLGRYKGGLISVQQNKRILPFQSLAKRTIGYKNKNVQPVGLEGAYSAYIDGESGKRMMQRIAGGVWMPVNQDIEIAPKEGADIISTIDINMQDVAQRALKKQLITSDADHGCVILMEVATGEIRAVANFSKVRTGEYEEQFNYAIAASQDPGSTFKLASYLSLLEDNKVDTNSMVATGDGTYRIPGHTIRDSHGGIGTVTVKKAFEESSNVAIAKMINAAYQNDQGKFSEHLYEWGLNKKLMLQIPGEGQPVIKNPENRSWNKKQTLPQMAYGYEMQITPLQMLAFYNAVANDGRYIAPIFVREIRRLGNTVEQFRARVINEKIVSDKTIKKAQALLEGVVTEGTGKGIASPLYRIAGKTGTAQVADANKGYRVDKKYQASFCGYFPADNPKYSLIVVVNNPRKGTYYAASVAGPVFREIADRVYASDVNMYDALKDQKFAGNLKMPESKTGEKKATQNVYKAFGIKALFAANSDYVMVDTNNGIANKEVKLIEGSVPDVSGMGLKDALYVLGNSGLKTLVRGSGRVVKQSLLAGTRFAKGEPIILELE